MKYSDLLACWLKECGYTHCFFVAGGNIMHLLESLSRYLVCIPVIHEVAAGIAAEYFNVTSPNKHKALALVTAGPGLTNIVTALAGAYLESRELLVIGGQVKTADLSRGKLRQRGIQEVDGVALAEPVTILSYRLEEPICKSDFNALCAYGSIGRAGPLFIEIPLDTQARIVQESVLGSLPVGTIPELRKIPALNDADIAVVLELLATAERPAVLIGGGVNKASAKKLAATAQSMHLPLFTTWNGADRIAADHPCYFGRPNTWGQRYSNLLIQQADLVIALGSRLGLQQTGFNWQQFVPYGKVVQVDCDIAELNKGHPRIDVPVCADVNEFLARLLPRLEKKWTTWHAYCQTVKVGLPLIEEKANDSQYVSPYRFVETLSTLAADDDVIIPCSSGSAFTVMMQVFTQKSGQCIVTNKGLASMGYGLSGAIGAAIANRTKRTILIEGDGGFAQNLQEIGTVLTNSLNLKIIIFDDFGYASIRMTQRNYFKGRYVGCDRQTGLGLPNWEKLFAAYDIPCIRLMPGFERQDEFQHLFNNSGPAAFIVNVDPEQVYFPKITSRVTQNGMESNPLHQMTPPLPEESYSIMAKYLK